MLHPNIHGAAGRGFFLDYFGVAIKKTALATLLAAAMAPVFASAADITANFTGAVSEQTCTINGGNANLNVPMQTVSAKEFKAEGDVVGSTPFQVDLTSCPAALTLVSGLFELGPNVDTATANLRIAAATTGQAANVQIGLLDSAGSKVRADGGMTPKTPVTSGSASIRMSSQYVATAANVGTGKTDTSVGFTIVYN